MQKRTFLKLTSIGAASLAFKGFSADAKSTPATHPGLPKVDLNVAPISAAERAQRVKKAQKLMAEHNIEAIVLDAGPAMDYFTGIRWWRSERLVGVVIPKQGDIAIVCPFFEEPSIQELLTSKEDIRVWQEHESPYKLVKQILKDRGITKGTIGFEHSVRYFIADGIMAELPEMTHASAEPVTLGCRMYKTAHELKLMHKASEITLAAYGYVYSQLRVGMTQQEVKQLMNDTQVKLGGTSCWSMALFNESSAYPHGTKQQQVISEGAVILMDSGCAVHGYKSDISRTFVFGKASKKARSVWNTVREGQNVAFRKAVVGTPAGQVDDAVRAYYESQGYGPLYKLPGLSHRTGHGIGMEGHESVNFVKGEPTPLQKGMCLSNEPGIYIPGEFGVRIEDCIYMGDERAHWFTEPPVSLDDPIGKLATLHV